VATRIAESIGTPFEIKGQQISVGISIGITIYPHDDHPIDELLKHADMAMYRAKQQGGNAFHLHEASGTPSANLLP
jgi:two-component system cell cycle response regulator